MLKTAPRTTCPECGRSNHPDAPRCDGCGRPSHTTLPPRPPPIAPRERPLVYLGIGAVAAIAFTLTPLLKFMGWFLASLVHETGHAAAAWAMGCPAIPAIRLDGHAAAVHGEQSKVFAVCVLIALVILAVRKRNAWLGAAAGVYPILAFLVRDQFFLLAGHLSEIAFGAVFFWRGLLGGFTRSRPERVLYSACAWYLVLGNVWLSGGLMFSERMREWYKGSGSFGLTNDYLRLAGSLHVGVGVVAFFMLLVALAALPVAWVFAARTAR